MMKDRHRYSCPIAPAWQLSFTLVLLCLSCIPAPTATSAFVQFPLFVLEPREKSQTFPIRSPLPHQARHKSSKSSIRIGRRRINNAPPQHHAVIDGSYMLLADVGGGGAGFGATAMAAASILVPLAALYVSATALQNQDNLTSELDQKREELRTQQTQAQNLGSLAQGLVVSGILFTAPLIGSFVNNRLVSTGSSIPATSTSTSTFAPMKSLTKTGVTESMPPSEMTRPLSQMQSVNTRAASQSLEAIQEPVLQPIQSSEITKDASVDVVKQIEPSVTKSSTEASRSDVSATTKSSPQKPGSPSISAPISDAKSAITPSLQFGALGSGPLVLTASALTGALVYYAREQERQKKIRREEQEREERIRAQQAMADAQSTEGKQFGYWVQGLVISGILLAAPLIVNNFGKSTNVNQETGTGSKVLVGKSSNKPDTSSVHIIDVPEPLFPSTTSLTENSSAKLAKKSISGAMEQNGPLSLPLKGLRVVGVTVAISAIILLGSLLLSQEEITQSDVDQKQQKVDESKKRQSQFSQDDVKKHPGKLMGQAKAPVFAEDNKSRNDQFQATREIPQAVNQESNKATVVEIDMHKSAGRTDDQMTTTITRTDIQKTPPTDKHVIRPVATESSDHKSVAHEQIETPITNHKNKMTPVATDKEPMDQITPVVTKQDHTAPTEPRQYQKESSMGDQSHTKQVFTDKANTEKSSRNMRDSRSSTIGPREQLKIVHKEEISLTRSDLSKAVPDKTIQMGSEVESISSDDNNKKLAQEQGSRVSTHDRKLNDKSDLHFLRKEVCLWVEGLQERLSSTSNLIAKPDMRNLADQIRLWTALSLIGAAFPLVQSYLKRLTWLICIVQLALRGRPFEKAENESQVVQKRRASAHITQAFALGLGTWIFGTVISYGLQWSSTAAFVIHNLFFGLASSFLRPTGVRNELSPGEQT